MASPFATVQPVMAFTATGAPWEWYVTDPAEVPDPKDWETEVFWPVARK